METVAPRSPERNFPSHPLPSADAGDAAVAGRHRNALFPTTVRVARERTERWTCESVGVADEERRQREVRTESAIKVVRPGFPCAKKSA
jgi:hypothetical protein